MPEDREKWVVRLTDLEQCRKRKDACCAMLLEAGSCNPRVSRQPAMATKERDGGLSPHEIGRFTRSARKEKSQSVDDFGTDALHTDLLAPFREVLDFLMNPIPSPADHLRTAEVRAPEGIGK